MSEPEVEEYFDRARTELLPMIKDSVVTLALNPSEPDAKMALEIGFSILLDKPIIVIGMGTDVPESLRRVARVVIEGEDVQSPEMAKKIQQAVTEIAEEINANGSGKSGGGDESDGGGVGGDDAPDSGDG